VKVDWTEMTGLEVYEALKAAPRRVFGPWRRADDGSYAYETWVRNSIGGSRAEWSVDGRLYVGRIVFTEGQCMSREAADVYLREAGWLLS